MDATNTYLCNAIRHHTSSTLEAFRVLGIAEVDAHIHLIAQRLEDDIIRALRVSHVRRTAANENWTETTTNDVIETELNRAMPHLPSNPANALPIPTFQNQQLIMLITKTCLAPKLTHLARCLRPSIASIANKVMDEAIIHVYAALMHRRPDQLSPTTRALIGAPSADGGLAPTNGGKGGDEASYVTGAMVVERHITDIVKLRQTAQKTLDIPVPMTHMHPLHLAAERIQRRPELIENGSLTQGERELQDCVQKLIPLWGLRRADTPPSQFGTSPHPKHQQGTCPTDFTSLYSSKPIRRSAWTRGVHAHNSNRRRAHTAKPWVIEDLQSGSNSFLHAIPCSQRTSIPDRAVAPALRSRYQEPHLSPGCPFHAHHCSRTSDRKLDHKSCSHFEICPGLGGLIAPHNEVVSALRNIIAAAGLARYDTIQLERLMSTRVKTNEDEDPDTGTMSSNSYSDLTFQTAEGEIVHVDVSIIHSASQTVQAAARNSPQGFYNQLCQRERSKLRTAQTWLNNPNLPDIPTLHEHEPMEEEDPDVTTTGASPSSQSGPSSPPLPYTNSTASKRQDRMNATQTDHKMSRPQSIAGAAPSYKDTSNDGKRRFIPFVLSSTGRLGPSAAKFFAELCKEARKRGHDFTAMGPTNADPSVVASLRADASWANRNFPAWAKQTISLAVCTSKALAIDRLLRNDKLTNLSQRGLGVTRRPPGAVGYNTNIQPPK